MSETRMNINSHNIIVEERNTIRITGVEEVDSYNENTIVLTTIKGGLSIKGDGLSISKLNLDDGSLNISGMVNSLSYISKEGEPKNLLGKIFK